jgi:hypothetical protein
LAESPADLDSDCGERPPSFRPAVPSGGSEQTATLTAVAVPFELIPIDLIRPHKLAQQLHVYEDWPEFRFHFGGPDCILPVEHAGGRITVARWGCRREESRVLPATGWTRIDRIESGYWRDAGAEEVNIPASRGYDNGFWVPLAAPIRAVLVRPAEVQAHVFIVCEPGSNYYLRMTRAEWMPALVGEKL